MENKILNKLRQEDAFYPYRFYLEGKQFIVNKDGTSRLSDIYDYIMLSEALCIDNNLWFLPHPELWKKI